MAIYKVHINDRDYTNWKYHNTINFTSVDLPLINPAEYKLFTNDTFTLSDVGAVQIIHSTVRTSVSIPGVIILKDNKTYGRYKPNKKLLYKCVPDDMRIPAFLIPYELKNLGFSKVLTNQYITFNYIEWTGKHPIGIISQLIGPVDILDNFYEYQLYCKSLNASIQTFNKDTHAALKTMGHDEFIDNISIKYPNIEDRTALRIFTIDPLKSVDFDDAFSIHQPPNLSHIIQLSIYISNVTIWLDVLNLWDSFSRRISTIYLPDRKRPMLPTILSDCLCSLQANHTRLAFVMDLSIDTNKMTIEDIKYSNCKIRVTKNYCYEEHALLKNPDYLLLLDITQRLSTRYKYINNVRNSHDVVCYLMILMNFNSAKELLRSRNGIFRTTVVADSIATNTLDIIDLPEDVCKFIKIWNSTAGQYVDAATLAENQSISHDVLEMDAYVHITSPIRRLVDLLNIIKFQQNNGMIELSENSARFYDKWIADLDYINTTMRSIRKVQNDCSLLQYVYAGVDNDTIIDKIYSGYAFDKIIRNDGLFQFVVYLPELKMTSRVTVREELNNYEKRQFKLYIFNNESKFKKKIRLQLVDLL
jgi:exoribonuclease R